MAVDLTEWRANLEKEVTDIVKNKLPACIKQLQVEWADMKSQPFCYFQDGFTNQLVPNDTPYQGSNDEKPLGGRRTGPNPRVELIDVHADDIKSSDWVGVWSRMQLLALDLQRMAGSLRLYLTLIAPPKRSSENLEASVQSSLASSLGEGLEPVCALVTLIVGRLLHIRCIALNELRKTPEECEDASQAIYELDQLENSYLKRCFIEFQGIFTTMCDILEVRNQSPFLLRFHIYCHVIPMPRNSQKDFSLFLVWPFTDFIVHFTVPL